MAHPIPQQHSPVHMIDAVHRASYAVDSLFALTDLMMIQSAASQEDLAHVDRQALAGLVSIVAAEIGRELKAAQQHYDSGTQAFTCSGAVQ